jgi:hypothetical protein
VKNNATCSECDREYQTQKTPPEPQCSMVCRAAARRRLSVCPEDESQTLDAPEGRHG